MGCLRRHTFCQQRQKVCKKRRQNQGFEILSAPHAGNVVIMRPTRLENFARGLKCSIVSAFARKCPDWRSRSGRESAGHADSTTQSFPAKDSFHVKNSPILWDFFIPKIVYHNKAALREKVVRIIRIMCEKFVKCAEFFLLGKIWLYERDKLR